MRPKIIFFFLFFLNFNLYSFKSSDDFIIDNSISFEPQGKVLQGFFEFSYISEDGRIILKLNKAKHLEKTAHPAQFPISIIRRLIKALSEEGDYIFDPYVGSGTTIAAAALENRIVAIEEEPLT